MNSFVQHELSKSWPLIWMIYALTGGVLRGSRRERLLSKFVENEYEKIDRLMELYIRYFIFSHFSFTKIH